MLTCYSKPVNFGSATFDDQFAVVLEDFSFDGINLIVGKQREMVTNILATENGVNFCRHKVSNPERKRRVK